MRVLQLRVLQSLTVLFSGVTVRTQSSADQKGAADSKALRFQSAAISECCDFRVLRLQSVAICCDFFESVSLMPLCFMTVAINFPWFSTASQAHFSYLPSRKPKHATPCHATVIAAWQIGHLGNFAQWLVALASKTEQRCLGANPQFEKCPKEDGPQRFQLTATASPRWAA